MERDHLRLVAAKAIIKNTEGKVLILRQSEDTTVSGAGKWHMPGGIVELNETPAQAVVREAKEETGLEITAVQLLDTGDWEADIRGAHFHFTGLFFECTISADPVTLDQTEVTQYKWIGPEDLFTVTILEPARTIIKRALQNKY